MVKQVIQVGTVADDGTGDKIRDAFVKVNANFDELYEDVANNALNIAGGGSGGIQYSDLSVLTASASGSGALAYNNTNGVFTFTPADTSGGGGSNPTFTVTNNGSGAYTVTGAGASGDGPTLYLQKGLTYTFTINASGHPFLIKTVQGSGSSNQYTSGVTGAGTDNGTVTFTVPMDAPDTLYYQCELHSAMYGVISTSSGGSQSRGTLSGTTSTNIADAANENVDITGHKGYALLKIETSAGAWVRVYTDAAARTADASRVQGVDPSPNAGVVAECITTGNASTVVAYAPGVFGYNNESSPTTTIPIAVKNNSGSTQGAGITVTLTAIQLEA
jgi:plastocyanin